MDGTRNIVSVKWDDNLCIEKNGEKETQRKLRTALSIAPDDSLFSLRIVVTGISRKALLNTRTVTSFDRYNISCAIHAYQVLIYHYAKWNILIGIVYHLKFE